MSGHFRKDGNMDVDLASMFTLVTIFNTLVVGIFLVYWGMVFVILYHLTRFGIGVQPKRFAALFLFGSLALSGVVVISSMNVDINALLPS